MNRNFRNSSNVQLSMAQYTGGRSELCPLGSGTDLDLWEFFDYFKKKLQGYCSYLVNWEIFFSLREKLYVFLAGLLKCSRKVKSWN